MAHEDACRIRPPTAAQWPCPPTFRNGTGKIASVRVSAASIFATYGAFPTLFPNTQCTIHGPTFEEKRPLPALLKTARLEASRAPFWPTSHPCRLPAFARLRLCSRTFGRFHMLSSALSRYRLLSTAFARFRRISAAFGNTRPLSADSCHLRPGFLHTKKATAPKSSEKCSTGGFQSTFLTNIALLPSSARFSRRKKPLPALLKCERFEISRALFWPTSHPCRLRPDFQRKRRRSQPF